MWGTSISANLVPHECISSELLRYPKNRGSFEYVRPFKIGEDVCYTFNVARSQELREQLRPIVFVCCDLLIQIESQGFIQVGFRTAMNLYPLKYLQGVVKTGGGGIS